MKTRLKKLVLTILSLIFLLSITSIFVVGATADTGDNYGDYGNLLNGNKQDNYGDYGSLLGTQPYSSFKIYDGASIRPYTPIGLRFETQISLSDKAKLDARGAQYGTLIIPKALLGDNELTLGTSSVLDIQTKNWLGEKNQLGEGYDGYLGTLVGGAAGNFANMDERYYGVVFCARGYVKYLDVNGSIVIKYTENTVERSIGGVAERFVASGSENTDMTAAAQTIVEKTDKVYLSYDMGGADAIADEHIVKGHVLSQRADPTKANSVFLGWYTTSDYKEGSEFYFDGALTETTTVYAKWTASNGEILPTTKNFVKNGKCDYIIVLPNNPIGYEQTAALELQKYIKQATGISLDIVNESQVKVTSTSKYIIIGKTGLAEEANVVAASAEALKNRGFRIKNVGHNVYIVGGDTIGTLNGVYEFLNKQFGFEVYADDEIYIQNSVKNVKLNGYDLTDNPDISYVENVGDYRDSSNFYEALTMRTNHYDDIFIDVTSQPWHNTFEYVPYQQYGTTHSDWYVYDDSGNPKQLNYLQKGTGNELSELQQLVFDKMTVAIDEDFAQGEYRNLIGFMHEDNTDVWVEDTTYTRTYGDAAPAAILIDFINPIAKKLEEYMATNHEGRDMNIVIFAYVRTEDAPTDMTLEDNVAVMIAPISADFTKEYEYNKTSYSTEIQTLIDEWSTVASKTAYWFYNMYHERSVIYYDNIYNMKGLYQAAVETGAEYVFSEMTSSISLSPMSPLREYLNTKLAWDASSDIDTLISNFFTNYYKDAATAMKGYFDTLHDRTNGYTGYPSLSGVGGANTGNYDFKTLWNQSTVSTLATKISQAFTAITPLETTNPELYRTLYDRIMRESLCVQYLQLQHHATDATFFSNETSFNNAVTEFKTECERLGITRYGIYEEYSVASLEFYYAA